MTVGAALVLLSVPIEYRHPFELLLLAVVLLLPGLLGGTGAVTAWTASDVGPAAEAAVVVVVVDPVLRPWMVGLAAFAAAEIIGWVCLAVIGAWAWTQVQQPQAQGDVGLEYVGFLALVLTVVAVSAAATLGWVSRRALGGLRGVAHHRPWLAVGWVCLVLALCALYVVGLTASAGTTDSLVKIATVVTVRIIFKTPRLRPGRRR